MGPVLSERLPRTAMMDPFACFSPPIWPYIPPPPGLEHNFSWKTCQTQSRNKRRRGPKPSPAKQARDAARRLSHRAGREDRASAISEFGQAVEKLLLSEAGLLGTFFKSLSQAAQKHRQRVRDCFPLPPLAKWPGDKCVPKEREGPALTIANLCILSLNILWADFKLLRVVATAAAPTAPQLEAQRHVADKVLRMLDRFASAAGESWCWRGAFGKFEKAAAVASEPLVGAAVDLPLQAATCDPLLHVDQGLNDAVREVSNIFPFPEKCLLGDSCATPSRSTEYLTLVSRELACGKLRLRLSVKGAAPVFAVGKSTAGRQRKVWNGAALSAAAAKPPEPPRLANPSSFLDLEIEPGSPIWFSKRDAETFFVLRVPDQLRPWFGQAAVKVSDLMEVGGCSLSYLQELVDDSGTQQLTVGDTVFPVNIVWPMGFSWSSVVAQSTTLARVTASGVALENVLSMCHPPPADQSELCMVATDDTVFMHREVTKGQETLANFDASLQAAGIPRKVSKDITLVEQTTALGCDISSRPHVVEPAVPKLLTCIAAGLDLLRAKTASPRAVNALLGLLQWFCLLQRPVFGVFHHVYDFVRQQPDRQRVEVPRPVLQEFAVALGLLPLLSVSLDKQYYTEILACDAAPEFGFGVSAVKCSVGAVSRLGRLSERRGDFVRVHKNAGEEPEKSRLGVPHRLVFGKKEFRTIVSSRAKWKAHSSTLEGHALLLTLKWLARSRLKHHKKVVILVDAKAVLGAAAKGRTSAPGMRSVIRAIGAHALACDLLVRLVYIPSEDNPADCPSRGRKVVRPEAGGKRRQKHL